MTRTKEPLVFGLDIGTRSIVGTVCYKAKDCFTVAAQTVLEHETRAMLDGQIHDIHAVGERIKEVVAKLEKKIGEPLTQVSIAAAGRVLKTVTVHADISFPEDKIISSEDILSLDSYAIEKAYEQFQAENKTDMKFYCVGYSVMKYYMNHYIIGNLEDHKAKDIGVDLIATFLPDDVVDGLYRAVEYAGLEVANLTLEPIAAIEVAIPEMYRMLNIGLIDVGAGTSDISITRDGSITAYGMLPTAGDSLTEVISRHCLVDFKTAEEIKRGISVSDIVEYKDIMGLLQKISKEEILGILKEPMELLARQAADKLLELNGNKPVSAVFIVGGGGKVEGYTDMVAECLGIPKERCAVRGEDVMDKIEFLDHDDVKDSLMVTPIGICLNYYQKSNNFIFVTFNNKRIKLYDNHKLSIIEAAIQATFPSEGLFPKRGESLTFIINGKHKVLRGEPGEAAYITLNGEVADIHAPIHRNDVIVVQESTKGAPAKIEIGRLPEYEGNISAYVNQKLITFPKFASVNGQLQSAFYEVKDGDVIEMLNFYSVKQIIEFMDVSVDQSMYIYVNNKVADLDTKVYENFSVIWTLEQLELPEIIMGDEENVKFPQEFQDGEEEIEEYIEEYIPEQVLEVEKNEELIKTSIENQIKSINIVINQKPLTLTGKSDYVYVDIFDFIDFDLSKPQGTSVVTTINGQTAGFVDKLSEGDVLEIFWKE